MDLEETLTKQHAEYLDSQDLLRDFRKEFLIPTKADLKRKTLVPPTHEEDSEESVYLCGNSLGLQPRRTRQRIDSFLAQWSTKAVTGHFVHHDDEPFPPFLDIDDNAAKMMVPIVGALESEVAVMGQLTANLLMMMSSFYRPSKERYKVILEGKAFPSDHYAIESQIAMHGFNPKEAMVLIEPDRPEGTLSTAHILRTIDKHALETALILLPGIQFYTGQYLDVRTITHHAHSKGLLIGWDCAHAAGNVELRLHDWDVDFAVWCNYKYLNSGPGAIGAMFVHERHGKVDMNTKEPFRPRLCGWWGADKETRFQMDNKFVPRPGAAGYQLSNPSALDLSAVIASLEIFKEASMERVRHKSKHITAYLHNLLLETAKAKHSTPFMIITSAEAEERGAQISIRLEPGLLDVVLHHLDRNGVVVDERKPDVIRVAPAPLYNSYLDVWKFVQVFLEACESATGVRSSNINGAASKGSAAEDAAQVKGDGRGTNAYGPNAK